MGESLLLNRRSSMTGQRLVPVLSPGQVAQDKLLSQAAAEARNPYTLTAIVAGVGIGKSIEKLGYAGLSEALPFLGKSKIASPLFKTGIQGTALAGNAGAFTLTERYFKVKWAGADSALLQWEGEQGIKNGWLSAFFNFGAFHLANPFTRNLNPLLRHTSNASILVAANHGTGFLAWTPKPEGTWAEQLIQASILDLQIQGGMQMLHGILPFLRTPSAKDILLHQQKSWFERPQEYSALAVFASPEGMGWFERQSLARIRGDLKQAQAGDIRWLQFRWLFRFLGREGKQALASDFARLLEEPQLSEKNVIFVLEALPKTFLELSPEQKSSLFEQAKNAYDTNPDPSFRLRWIYLIRDLLPHLEAHTRLQALRLALEADLNPNPGLAETGDSILYAQLEKLSPAELMHLGESLATMDFPQSAGQRVRQLLHSLTEQTQQRIREMGDNENSARFKMARWLGALLGSPESIVAGMANLCWLEFIQKLPETDAHALIREYHDQFSLDNPNYFYWAVFADRQLAHPEKLDPFTQHWYELRRQKALQHLNQNLRGLAFPAEWTELSRKNVESVNDLVRIQEALRGRLKSMDNADSSIISNWWKDLPDGNRWFVLELFVGPQKYLRITGAEARRLIQLAGEGLGQETGLASKKYTLENQDDVLFTLGNRNSVGLPDAFISASGHEEASHYLMLHHSHPRSSTGRDLNQIYPSTYTEGGSGGDLHALYSRFEKMQEGERISLAVTHALGGSIFSLHKRNGKAELSIYSGIKNSAHSLQDRDLVALRQRIRAWAEKEKISLDFYEAPYHFIEGLKVPDAGQARKISD